MGDTAIRPGGDAAMVRVRGSKKGLALTVDCTPRYVKAAPETGGAQAVAESWRNITATGARPLAITNNMNFGNPQKPQIMGQFVGAINGMRAACIALDYPVVSGNVSLYNETEGTAILPTPVIGGVGVIADIDKRGTVAFKAADQAIIVIGETTGWLGQSIYLREIEGRERAAAGRSCAGERMAFRSRLITTGSDCLSRCVRRRSRCRACGNGAGARDSVRM